MKKVDTKRLLGLGRAKLKGDATISKKVDYQLQGMKLLNSNPFLALMLNHRLPYNIFQFLIVSIAFAVIYGVVYTMFFRDFFITFGFAFLGFLIPYTYLNSKALMNDKVRENMECQSFIEILQTELRVTTSIGTIFENIVKRGTNGKLTNIMNHAIRNLQFGESVPDVLTECERMTEDRFIKIVFVILRINYNLGSSETIEALEVVKQDFITSISNNIELTDKLSGHIGDKNIFVLLASVLPIILNFYKEDYFGSFLSLPYMNIVLVLIIGFAFLGGFLIDRKVQQMVEVI